MSLVTYNNVVLPYASITNFSQQGVSADEGGEFTDLSYTKFDIAVATVVNANYLAAIDPTLVGATRNPADIMNDIRAKLLARRKPLSVKFAGVELIPQVSTNLGTVDSRNGPIPQSCDITQLTNETFLVSWRVVAHYFENPLVSSSASPLVTNQKGNPVLFNRWEETVDLDNLGMSTRTRRGKFIIRSDNAQGYVADQLRTQMAVTSIPSGFLRRSSSYTQSSDGLGLAYTIVDEEVFKVPPYPAMEADGEYIETTGKGGAVRYGQCRVLLKGGKYVNQDKLIQLAVSIVCSKLYINGASVAGNPKGNLTFSNIQHASLRVGMYRNEVECMIQVMMQGGKSRLQGVNAFADVNRPSSAAAQTPLSDRNSQQPIYLDRGSASLLLQAAAYYDPSLAGTTLGPGTPTTTNNVTQTGGTDKSQLTAGLKPGQAGLTRET